MAEIRLQIDDEMVKRLRDKLGADVKVTDMAREAMTMFNWAVDERSKGRLVLSSDDEGEKMTRLAMNLLDKAAPEQENKVAVA